MRLCFSNQHIPITAYCYKSNSVTGCFVKALPMGQNIVRQIVHKTTRTDINSRALQAAVIVQLFSKFKVNKKQKQISF